MLPLLSPLNHLSSRGLGPITINRDVTPLSQGPHILTHLLSEELRGFVGTHLSIETSWPPALPAHHWITMVSLCRGKNRSRSWCRDSAHRHHRWDKAVAKRREGVFWAVPLSVPLSLLLPPGAACASLTSLAGCWRETAALVFAWKESPR